MRQQIRVIIADDEPRLRSAWGRIIESQEDLSLIGMLDSADNLAANIPDEDSIVLLDLSMPGRDPLEAAAELRDSKPQCRVIFYSGHSDPETIQRAVEAGAWAFVDKLSAPPDILDVIRRVAAGEAVIS